MFRSVVRNAMGETCVRGTFLPVDYALQLMGEGCGLESIAETLAPESEEDLMEAVHCALLFPEAVLGWHN